MVMCHEVKGGRRLVELWTLNEVWDDGWRRHHTARRPAPHIFGMTSCRRAGQDDSPSSDCFDSLQVPFHPSARAGLPPTELAL